MVNALEVDKPGDAGDWRMNLVARVDGDQGQYKDNEIIRHMVSAEERPGLLLSYAVPSSVALALSIAETAAQNASTLKLQIPYQPLEAGNYTAFGVTTDGIPKLYDFFEQSMIAAVFSYQAIETYANWVIGHEVQSPMKVCRGKKIKELNPEQLARQLKTNEKLLTVLPEIKRVDSPEGSTKWKRFLRLEATRDATVHLKHHDQFGKDREALFFRMLNLKMTELPSTAVVMIHHYFKPETEPRWLLKFMRLRDHS